MAIISRFAKSFLLVIAVLGLLSMVAFLHPPARAYIDPWTGQLFGEGGVEGVWRNDATKAVHGYTSAPTTKSRPDDGTRTGKEELEMSVHGGVIMSKLGNATAKAALGRATWKLLHTMTLRFPEHPTPDERTALASYFHLLSRLYPCGECAAEFQALLKKYPPQTSSRRAAALWLCSVHNQVNERLGKPRFDCAKLDAEYDCGCGDDPSKKPKPKSGRKDRGDDPMDLERDQSVDRDTGVEMVRGG
ncbi:hypothetical protein APHAL10511_005449 [Amanita phalloides]|nr:hypothetical protein APHAL10511_005449 [Amanita phalloides]